MARYYYLLFLAAGCMFVPVLKVQGASFSDLDSLTTSLFSGYKLELRPFVDDTTPTYVHMGIWLASIQELNEVDQSLVFSGFLYIEWVDPRLVWDISTHNGTQYFAYPQKQLWIPDVTIVNSVRSMTELGFDRLYSYVWANGQVTWLPGGVYETSCDIDITYYPFDTQTCSVIFSTLVSGSMEIELETDPTFGVNLDSYSPSGTWELLSVTAANTYTTKGKSKVSFDIKMKRLTSYYVITIVIPVLFLSLTATLVFALPADSGEKMGTSITVLLAFAVYLTIVSEQMPKTSLNVSVLSLYLSALLGQTSMGVVLSVWILNLHFRDDQDRAPSPGYRRAAVFMQRLMRKRPWNDAVSPLRDYQQEKLGTNASLPASPKVETEDSAQGLSLGSLSSRSTRLTTPSEAISPSAVSWPLEDMSWKEVSVAFDRFLFYFFSIFLTATTVICLSILGFGGAASG